MYLFGSNQYGYGLLYCTSNIQAAHTSSVGNSNYMESIQSQCIIHTHVEQREDEQLTLLPAQINDQGEDVCVHCAGRITVAILAIIYTYRYWIFRL